MKSLSPFVLHVALSLAPSLALTGCITAQPTVPRPTHWANELKADANFYQVDTHLYRSEQPIIDDVPAINAQAIKTIIINLRHTKANDDTALFGDDITLIKEPLITWRVRPTDIARVLYLIEKHQKNGSVLVHCRHGADRTGIVIAMYRIIYQDVSIKDARDEMRHGNYGYHLIWKNLDNLLNDVGVAQVKAELSRLKTANPI